MVEKVNLPLPLTAPSPAQSDPRSLHVFSSRSQRRPRRNPPGTPPRTAAGAWLAGGAGMYWILSIFLIAKTGWWL